MAVSGIGGSSPARKSGREHIPEYPAPFLFLRIAQLVIGVVILGLDAYGLSRLSFSGDQLNMFTAIATLITTIYIIVALSAAPAIHNYWAILSLDALLIVFWLVSFALLASQVAPYLGSSGEYCDDFGRCARYGLYGEAKVVADCFAAVAGLGGLEFLLFVIALIIDGICIHVHRSFDLHSMPGKARPVGPVSGEKAAGDAVSAVPMHPVQSSVQPVYQSQPGQPLYQTQPGQPVYPTQQAQQAQPVYQAQPLQPAPFYGIPVTNPDGSVSFVSQHPPPVGVPVFPATATPPPPPAQILQPQYTGGHTPTQHPVQQ